MSVNRGQSRRVPIPPEVLRVRRQHSREVRDRRLRAGRAVPKTRRERDLYAEGWRERGEGTDDEDDAGAFTTSSGRAVGWAGWYCLPSVPKTGAAGVPDWDTWKSEVIVFLLTPVADAIARVDMPASRSVATTSRRSSRGSRIRPSQDAYPFDLASNVRATSSGNTMHARRMLGARVLRHP